MSSGRIHLLFGGAAAAACLAIAAPPTDAAVLHDQLTPSATDNVNSQNFEPALNAYDDLGADDLVVPDGMVWRINQVEVSASGSGTSQAATANLFLFADAGTLPGAEILNRANLPRGTGATYPDLNIPVSDLPVLPPGHYWIGVQANLTFSPGSNNWWWRDRAPQFGQAAAWRQPGDGFGDGCTSFVTRASCPSYPGSGGTPDQAFRLSGDSASSRLEVLKAKVKRHGKVKLKVNAPNVGDLVATSKNLKTAHDQVTQIGPTDFVMKAKGRTRDKLEEGERVKVKIKLTLPSLLGQTLTAREKIKLKP